MMKTINRTLLFVLLFALIPFLKSEAQVRIGGKIDIKIDLPEIVIIDRVPERIPSPRRKPPVVIKERLPRAEPCECDLRSQGEIINQNNGPRFDYSVIDAKVEYFPNNELDLVFHLDTGDIMVIAMVEVVPNDFNFHFYKRPSGYNNTILSITLNNTEIALNSAAVSLQPSENGGFSAVLNLHSVYDGDFNGTVNYID